MSYTLLFSKISHPNKSVSYGIERTIQREKWELVRFEKGGWQGESTFPLFSGPVYQGWVPLCTCWSPVRACGLILKIMEFLGSHIHVKGLSSSIYKFFGSDF